MLWGLAHKKLPFAVPNKGVWLEDYTIHKLVYGHENETFKFFERKLSRTDIVADVGAHNGEYCGFFARRCKAVDAFEPDPVAFQKLQKATAKFKNITLHQKAVGEKAERMRLGGVPGSGVNSLFHGHQKGEVEVDVIPLPDHYTWAKIDVEGAELSVLAGLRRPINCTIEFSPGNLRKVGQNPEQFIADACSFGYEWWAIDNRGVEYKATVAKLIETTQGHTNIYLKPTN